MRGMPRQALVCRRADVWVDMVVVLHQLPTAADFQAQDLSRLPGSKPRSFQTVPVIAPVAP
jgi:hypothetical protein